MSERLSLIASHYEQGWNAFYMGLTPESHWSDAMCAGWLAAKAGVQ